MKVFVCLLVAALTIGSVASAQTQDPPCYSDRPAPAHYRTETSPNGSTLRVVGVYVDPAIDTGNFAAGITSAMNNWNGATDPNGVDLPYRFERVTSPSQAGIQIAGGGEASCNYGCACYSPSTHTIRTTAALRDNTVGQIAGIIGHEMGHPMGLANSANLTATSVSIMQGYQGDCDPVTGAPQPIDVAQINRHSTVRTTCTQTQRRTGGGNPADDDFCVDSDNNGVCDYDDGGGGDGGGGDGGGGDGGGGCQWTTTCTQYCYTYTECTVYDDCGDCYYYEDIYTCDPPECVYECV